MSNPPHAVQALERELYGFTAPPHASPSTASPSSQTQSAGGDSSAPSNATTGPTSEENGSPAQGSSANAADSKSREQTVPAACLGCRNKHLKCDGQTPCSRCITSGYECVYVASRRGYKGPRRGASQNPNKRQATSPPEIGSGGADCPMLLGATVSGPMAAVPGVVMPGVPPGYTSPHGITSDQLYQSYRTATGMDPSNGAMTRYSTSVPALAPPRTLDEKCIDSFYFFFHGGHPFVLPKDHLLRKAKEGTIEPLLAAMKWAGSLYIDVAASRPTLYDKAMRLILDPQQPENGFLLQAMMVLIVALDGTCQNEKARELLGEAERMALGIDINTRPFATLHGEGLPVLEESWRRTWWDLFVIDGMIAGVHRVTNFLLFDVPTDVGLPCEEQEYLSGNIPPPMYLGELEDREFTGEEREFSSFAYRILCGRNLGKYMRAQPILGPDDENVGRIEALLTNWRLHLPDSKKYALDRNGQLDEMMFQANMMVNATSILLHQPLSQLDSTPAQDITSCAPHRQVPHGDLFNAHTKHTIASATEISKLITHRVPLLSHTHFFTCVVTLSSIIHLSRWALYFVPHDDEDLRQQLRLNIGALNKLSEVWSAADRARGQVKGVAHDIYRIKKQQHMNPQYWLGFTQEQMVSTIAADDDIINEIEALPPVPIMPADMMG